MDENGITIFVYDNKVVPKEEDDPTNAILCFYPQTVSRDQRVWLCGSLIAIIRSLESLTGCTPDMAEFNNFKFSILKNCGYLIVLGASAMQFSTSSVTEMCLNFLDNVFFFYSSVDSLILKLESQGEAAAEADKLGSLIQTITDEHWSKLESNTNPLCNDKEVPQPVMLKCMNVLKFCSSHDGVFASCLLFQRRVLLSLMNENLTKLCVTASCCPAVGYSVDLVEGHSCRLIPVYLSGDEYDKLVRMQLQTCAEFEWKRTAETRKYISRCDRFAANQVGGTLTHGPIDPEDISVEYAAKKKSLGTLIQMNRHLSVPNLRGSTMSDVHSAGSLYDTASCASDSQPLESGSDSEVFVNEQLLDNNTEMEASNHSPATGEEGYLSAQNDLCKFLQNGNYTPEGCMPTYGEKDGKRQKNACKAVCRCGNCHTTVQEAARLVEHDMEEAAKTEYNKAPSSSQADTDAKKFKLFVCSDGELELIILVNNTEDKGTTAVEIMQSCAEEFDGISRQLMDQGMETPKVGRSHPDERTSTRHRSADECNIQESVTEFHNMLCRHPGLRKISLLSPEAAFHAEHAFGQTSHFHSHTQ